MYVGTSVAEGYTGI